MAAVKYSFFHFLYEQITSFVFDSWAMFLIQGQTSWYENKEPKINDFGAIFGGIKFT